MKEEGRETSGTVLLHRPRTLQPKPIVFISGFVLPESILLVLVFDDQPLLQLTLELLILRGASQIRTPQAPDLAIPPPPQPELHVRRRPWHLVLGLQA